MTEQLVLRHLSRDNADDRPERKVYTTSRRSSGFALPMIDIDAHEGQTDALELVRFIGGRYFPHAYWELSSRGAHIHPLFRVRGTHARTFNRRMKALQRDLGLVARAYGFESRVEVKGEFTLRRRDGTVERRASLAALPSLWNGSSDVARLIDAPVFELDSLDVVARDAAAIQDCGDSELPSSGRQNEVRVVRHIPCTPPPPGPAPAPLSQPTDQLLCAVTDDGWSDDAFRRMHLAYHHFVRRFGRLPHDTLELVLYYGGLYRRGPTHPERDRRAANVLEFWRQTFDPALAGTSGYAVERKALCGAVVMHCRFGPGTPHPDLTAEDLAIGLYVVTRSSFQLAAKPALQYTVGNAQIAAMFHTLAEAGMTNRRCRDRGKAADIKRCLQDAGLIVCRDERYVPAGGKGICKKFVVGPHHPQIDQFREFDKGVRVTLVADLRRSRPAEKPTDTDARRGGRVSTEHVAIA